VLALGLRVRVIERAGDDAHFDDAALNPALLEEASELPTLFQDTGREVEAEEADAAATAAAAADRPPAAPTPADVGVDVARRVVARWRAFVAQRKACPLLDLLQALPDLFHKEVLERLDPTDRALLAQVGRPWLAAVLASMSPDLPRAGKSAGVPLKLKGFVGSVKLLAWARANGCPWTVRSSALAAAGGRVDVLKYVRAHGCPWNKNTCVWAALGGHLEVLVWAREHGCEWDEGTCACAAQGGHLEVLKWAREHHCPWGSLTCAFAASGGYLEVLRWAREHHCRWDYRTCDFRGF
jgi:hypothetical protein